jgi:capsular polysaccharide biosynthesis protein
MTALAKVRDFVKRRWKLLLIVAAMIIAVAAYYFIKIKRKQ